MSEMETALPLENDLLLAKKTDKANGIYVAEEDLTWYCLSWNALSDQHLCIIHKSLNLRDASIFLQV